MLRTHTTNTYIDKSESKTIELFNRAYEDIREEVKREARRFEKNESKGKRYTTVHGEEEIPWTVIVIILAIIIGISVVFIAMQ